MHPFDVRHRREKFNCKMIAAAGSRGAVVEYVRPGLCQRDQILDRFHRHGRVASENVVCVGEIRDQDKVLERIVFQFGAHRRVDGHFERRHEKRVSVRLRTRRNLSADSAGSSRSIIDDEITVDILIELFDKNAGNSVSAATRRKRYNYAHRSFRPFLCQGR